MMNTTRRRFIGITAAVSASALMPYAWSKNNPIEPTLWEGMALGANAQLRLYHPNRAMAEHLIQQALTEVTRLENLFSVYQENSQINQLNRTGTLQAPAADFVALLSQAQSMHRLTQGAFDPTVQVLWQRYAQHFTQYPKSETAPNVQDLISHVGLQHLSVSPTQLRFNRPKMAITLNGIAQGFITDRVTQILQQGGMQHALVNMGEIRHLDTLHQHPEFAKIKNPTGEGVLNDTRIPLNNQALATSGGYGTPFDAQGKFTHLFDPRTGNSRPRYQSVSVLAANATLADALSTAFAVSHERDILRVAQSTGAKVWLITLNGTLKPINV